MVFFHSAKGIYYTIRGGDDCHNSYNGYYGADESRSFSVLINCDTDAENDDPAYEEVDESITCKYSFEIFSKYGCPRTCPISTDGYVCNGVHGNCVTDDDNKMPKCMCDEDEGWFGPSCENRCPGAASISLDGKECSGNGHCFFDHTAIEARCFCNTGFGGKLCEKERATDGSCSSGALWVIIVVLLVLFLAFYVYHRRAIEAPINPCADFLYCTEWKNSDQRSKQLDFV